MTDRAVLQTEIEASGMVSGRNVAVRSIDDIKRAAAGGADGLKRYDVAIRGVGSALQNSNAAGSASIRTLGEQIRQATGLARAYTQGEEAVRRYNVEMRVEEALAKANITATGAQGRALANLVRQREAATAAVEREKAALAQRTAAAEAEAVANSQQVGMLSRLQSAYLASAVAGAVVVGAIRDVASAALEAEANERRLASAVERRGETFRMSTADLVAMASQFERTTAFEDDAIQKAQAILLRFDEIDATNIREVLAATLDFAEATGQDAASAATAFGKALLVPGEAMRSLKEVGIDLTQQQQDMVEAWNETGQSAKSVALLVGMMNAKIGGEAEKAAQTGAGGIKQLDAAIGNLKETLGGLASSREALVFLQMLAAGVRGVDEAIKRDGIDAKIGKFLLLPGLTSAANAWKIVAEELGLTADKIDEVKRAAASVSQIPSPPPIVPKKSKEELDAAAAAAKALADRYQDLVDKAFPASAAARQLADDVKFLRDYMASAKVPLDVQNTIIANLTGKWAEYGITLESNVIPQMDAVIDRAALIGTMKAPKVEAAKMTIESIDIRESFEREMADASTAVARNLEGDLKGSFSGAIADLLTGGEDVAKKLGDAIKASLANAVADYLSSMLVALAKELAVRLANAAKEAAARRALDAAGGGPMQSTGGAGSLSSLFGGSSAMSGLGTFAAVIGVFAAAVAVFKHQTDRHEAVQYGTISGAVATGGAVQYDYTGKLDQTGPQVAAAIGSLLNAFQEATGAFILGTASAEVQIRNDKERFRALVNGVLVGEFETVNEAIIAAAKGAFLGSNLSAELDPILAQVIGNFKGTDPQDLIDTLNSVRAITDELSGISEIEVRLRDLPTKVAAMSSELMRNGVAYDDARALAERWRVSQLADIRDELTGRQKTNAELMAEQERKAAMYNAEVTLLKAETQLKRDELAARVAALEASGNLFEGQVTLDQATITAYSSYLQAKNEIFEQEVGINQWYLETMGVAANASLLTLKAQLAALDQMLANMPDLINPGEIRLPNSGGGHGGGGNVNVGPSRADLRRDFLEEIDQIALGGLPQAVQGVMSLGDQLADLARRAQELGVSEDRLAAARQVLIDQQKKSILDPIRSYLDPSQGGTAGMSDWQVRAQEIQSAFDEARQANQALIDETGERAIAFWRLNEAEIEALHQLAEDAVDSLGLPLENTRDQIAAWTDTLAFLTESLNSGAMSAERYGQVVGEVAQQAEVQFLSLAQSILEQMGATKEAAAIKAQLEQANFYMQIAQLNLLFNALSALGKLGEELQNKLSPILDFINDPANWPDFSVQPTQTQSNYDNGQSAIEAARARREQALVSALDRLRAIQERYVSLRENATISELSGATLQQRSDAALALLNSTITQAQAGNLDALEQVPELFTQYMQILGQFIDPSSAQYQAMRDALMQQIGGLENGIAGVLAGAQSPAQQQVHELQNIADILTEMRDLWGITRPWNPGSGLATILPGPSAGGGTTAGGGNWDQNPHAGQVYYGWQWGWHPLGWSPGGQTPPDPFSAPSSRVRSGTVAVSDPAAAAALTAVANRLLQIESKLERGFSKSAGATDRQTEFMKASGVTVTSARSRQKWAAERDEAAS